VSVATTSTRPRLWPLRRYWSETLPSAVWEPACGPGAIVGVLRAAGHTVIATDLNDWGCPDSESRRDFLFEQRAPEGCGCIITNPPYKLAHEFVLYIRAASPEVSASLNIRNDLADYDCCLPQCA
jgi:hypothetical protein